MGKAKVGVLFVHGIGAQGATYAAKDIKALQKMLGKDAEDVVFEAFCWQPSIQPRQESLASCVKGNWWRISRKLLVCYGGDAVCYQPRHGLDSLYKRIHAGLDVALSRLARLVEPDGKLVIVAHSLGTVIVNNFIWDAQHEDSVGAASVEPSAAGKALLRRLGALFTLGSPVSIWALRYDGGGEPIELPEGCVWHNIYCPSDVIGWPVKNINHNYAKVPGLTDHRMWVGGLLSRFTPLSHLGYTGNRKVRGMIVDDIKRML